MNIGVFLLQPLNFHLQPHTIENFQITHVLLYGNGVSTPLLVFAEVGEESSWRR